MITLLTLSAACGDDGTVVTATETGSTGGSTTSDTTSTTNPTSTTTPTTTTPTTTEGSTGTTNPTTTTDGSTGTTDGSTSTTSTTTEGSTGSTGSTGGSTTEASTGGSTTEASTGGSTTEASTGGSTGMPDVCANGVQDVGETDIDCGGPLCNDCTLGQMCLLNDDCDTTACSGGVCVMPECGKDEDCAMVADACNSGVCDIVTFKCTKVPANEGMACDDANLCTTGEKCLAGACAAGLPKDCAAFNTFCGIGECAPETGECITGPNPMQDGMACDDANACTAATTCAEGFCGDPKNQGYLFHENFSNPDPGWKLDMNWQIGAAKVSAAGGGGTGTDPATDHTASADNKLAGQLIGDLITANNTMQGQFNCLTSPAVDTSGLPTAWVTFWRHAHLDYTNFVVNRLEVWDGAKWVLLEQGYPNVVTNDLAWKEIKWDVTAYKNAQFQFRICHQRNAGAYTHGGWSIDDLTIGEKSCTP